MATPLDGAAFDRALGGLLQEAQGAPMFGQTFLGTLADCFPAPRPPTFEELLELLYDQPHFTSREGEAFCGPGTLFVFTRMAQELCKAQRPQRSVASVKVSPHADGAWPTPTLVVGDLQVNGDLDIDEGAWLVCTGDVTVDGLVSDYSPGGTLVVGGALKARDMSTMGTVMVLGDVEIERLLLAHRNDDALFVGGRLRAGAVIQDDHTICCATPLEAALRFDDGWWDRQLAREERLEVMRAVLVPEVFEQDDPDEPPAFRADAADTRMREHLPVLTPDALIKARP